MRYPVNDYENWYIAQDFGAKTDYGYHEGIDLNLKSGGNTDLGQEIRAIANGTITHRHYTTHPNTGFGRHLIYRIDGEWGSRWIHQAHMLDTDFLMGPHDSISEGVLLGRVGKSGTTLAHLHFAIMKFLPTYMDNIANNLDELNLIWENPVTFFETWMPTNNKLFEYRKLYTGLLDLIE